ncbi:hypothetical protein FOXYSP1_11267 [Fusarium oxysporum f. sp. phaseoli]
MNLFLCLLLIPIVLLAIRVRSIGSAFSSTYYRAKSFINDISGKMHSSTISDSPELESNKPNENNDRVPPNGGARAWACVAGSFLLQFCSMRHVSVVLLGSHVQGPVVISLGLDHHSPHLHALHVRPRCWQDDRRLWLPQDTAALQYHGCFLRLHAEPLHTVLASYAYPGCHLWSGRRWSVSSCHGNSHSMVLDKEGLGCRYCFRWEQFRRRDIPLHDPG